MSQLPVVSNPPVFPLVLGGTTLGPHQGSGWEAKLLGRPCPWPSQQQVQSPWALRSPVRKRNQSAAHLPRVEQLCCDAHHLINPTASLFPFPARLGCQKYKKVHSTLSSQAAGCVPGRNWLDVQRTASPEQESFFPLFLNPREHKRQHSLTPWLTANITPPQMSGTKPSPGCWPHQQTKDNGALWPKLNEDILLDFSKAFSLRRWKTCFFFSVTFHQLKQSSRNRFGLRAQTHLPL